MDVLFPQAVRSDRPARRQVLPDERGRPDRSECPLCPLDVSVPLCCRLSEAFNLLSSNQVFDATNTTRERRDLILAFGKENAFKVNARSYLFCLAVYVSFFEVQIKA